MLGVPRLLRVVLGLEYDNLHHLNAANECETPQKILASDFRMCPQFIMSAIHYVRNSLCPQFIMSAIHCFHNYHVAAALATRYKPASEL